MTPREALDAILDYFGPDCEVEEVIDPPEGGFAHGPIWSCAHCGRSCIASVDDRYRPDGVPPHPSGRLPIHTRCWPDYRSGKRAITSTRAVGAYARRRRG